MTEALPYRDFTQYLRLRFPHFKVQKISINAGFTCPNRDGTKGWGGCTYCNNSSFSPSYTMQKGAVREQVEEGIRFFGAKYPNMRYLAYFQSYTNTYGQLEELTTLYEEALSIPQVEGIIIGTRPDCISDELLAYFEDLSQRTFLYIEYGVESTKEETLRLINRGHSYQESVRMIQKSADVGIPVGVHLIMGLPGEVKEDLLTHIDRLSTLPITSLKLHQLQILRGTIMGQQYLQEPSQFDLFTLEEYLELIIEVLCRIRPDIYLDRFTSQAPPEMVLAPKWNTKNYIFTQKVISALKEQGLSQGCHYAITPEC